MIYENVELHNVAEIEREAGVPGVLLRRIPRAVREALHHRAKFTSAQSSGCEVRLVTDSPSIRVHLFGLRDESDVTVFCGDFVHSQQKVPAGTLRTIQLDRPGGFENVKPEALHRGFAPTVWRFGFNRAEMAFVSADAFGHAIRPPNENEKPRIRWVAHGSSITHSNFENGYPHIAARVGGFDVLNLGLSGTCHAEAPMADFIATRGDWDIATVELGINMRGSFTTEEFRDRSTYLIHRIVDANPTKPVRIITHFPTNATHHGTETTSAQREREYDQALRDIVAARRHPKLAIIEGASLLDRFDFHSVDLIHPSTLGHVRMGMNLAARLAEIPA